MSSRACLHGRSRTCHTTVIYVPPRLRLVDGFPRGPHEEECAQRPEVRQQCRPALFSPQHAPPCVMRCSSQAHVALLTYVLELNGHAEHPPRLVAVTDAKSRGSGPSCADIHLLLHERQGQREESIRVGLCCALDMLGIQPLQSMAGSHTIRLVDVLQRELTHHATAAMEAQGNQHVSAAKVARAGRSGVVVRTCCSSSFIVNTSCAVFGFHPSKATKLLMASGKKPFACSAGDELQHAKQQPPAQLPTWKSSTATSPCRLDSFVLSGFNSSGKWQN